MLREKLVDKKHLKAIREKVFELQERIKNGEIDAEKTAEGFYKGLLIGRIFIEFLGILLIAGSFFMFGAVRYGITTKTAMFNIFLSASLGIFLLLSGVALLIKKDFFNFAVPLEIKLFFKSSEEEVKK